MIKKLKETKKQRLVKLNLGCGLDAPSDWINIDASFTMRLSKITPLYKILCKIGGIKQIPWPKNIKIIDVKKGLPFKDNSVDAIFSSHMIEHLYHEDAKFVVEECYRCLREGGVIRLIVPDLYQIAKKYVDITTYKPNETHSHKFLQELLVLDKHHKGIKKIIHKFFGYDKHLCMYDEWSLKNLLENQGFCKIKRMKYGQSRIPDIKSVESKGRHEKAVVWKG